VVAAGAVFATVANATVLTWNFASDPKYVTQGTAYNATGGPGTINVYAEQVNGSGVLQTIPDASECGNTGTVVNGTTFGLGTCLFSTNTSVYSSFESGIGPFDPTNNNANDVNNGGATFNSFADQLGITPTNVIELWLNSNIPNGTTLSFLLQGPTIEPGTPSTDTQIRVWTGNASTPENLGGAGGLTEITGSPFGAGVISPQGTTTLFSINKTSTNEVVALEADCEYILLTQITGSTPPVPEPRFYGILMAALLVLAGVWFRNRRVAVAKHV